MPQCGFSRASVQILGLQGVDPKKFAAVNVLESDEVRQGLFFFLYSPFVRFPNPLQVLVIEKLVSNWQYQ